MMHSADDGHSAEEGVWAAVDEFEGDVLGCGGGEVIVAYAKAVHGLMPARVPSETPFQAFETARIAGAGRNSLGPSEGDQPDLWDFIENCDI